MVAAGAAVAASFIRCSSAPSLCSWSERVLAASASMLCRRWPFSSDWRSRSLICRSSESSRWSSVTTDGLGRRRLVREARGVGRASLGKDLALHLLDLALEAVEALFGCRRLALGQRGSRNQSEARVCGKQADLTEYFQLEFPTLGNRRLCPAAAFARMNPRSAGSVGRQRGGDAGAGATETVERSSAWAASGWWPAAEPPGSERRSRAVALALARLASGRRGAG